MENKECQVCGSKVRDGDTICRTCGSSLKSSMMNGSNNNQMNNNLNNNMQPIMNPNYNHIVHEFVCPNCGVRIPDNQIHQFVRCSANNQYMNQNMNNNQFNGMPSNMNTFNNNPFNNNGGM